MRMRKARRDKTDICDRISRHFDVEGLCKGLPDRVQKVIDSEGDRIKKRPVCDVLIAVCRKWYALAKIDAPGPAIRAREW